MLLLEAPPRNELSSFWVRSSDQEWICDQIGSFLNKQLFWYRPEVQLGAHSRHLDSGGWTGFSLEVLEAPFGTPSILCPLHLVPPLFGAPLYLGSPPWSACSRSIWWRIAPAKCSAIEFRVENYQPPPPHPPYFISWIHFDQHCID